MRLRRLAKRSLAAVAITCVVALVALGLMAASPSSANADAVATTISKDKQRELLEHAKIGVLGGSLSEIRLEENFPDADRQSYQTPIDALTALSTGKVDYAVCIESTARLFMKTHDGLTYFDPSFYSMDNSYLIKKGNSELKGKINAALAKMRDSGELTAIYNKWVYQGDYTTDDIPVREDGELLRVACGASTEPTIFNSDGKIVGADAEIIQRVAYELGMRVEFQDMAFAACLNSVATGASDVALGYSYTEERAKTVDFTDAYSTNNYVFVTRADNVPEGSGAGVVNMSVADQYAMLAGKNVATAEGTIDNIELTDSVPDANVLAFPSDPDSMAALAAGKVDYVSLTEVYAILYQRENPGYIRVTPCYLDYEASFGVSKDNTELREKMDGVIAQMREDGTLDELYDKWILRGDYTMDDVPVLDDAPVLTVAVNSANEPQTFVKDGVQMGYDAEVIMRVAYALGMKVEFTTLNFSAIVPSLVAGKIDVACGPAATEERREQIDFTEPYLITGCCLVYRDNGTATKGILEDIEGKLESTFVTEGRWKLVVSGLGMTLAIAVGSFALASVVGMGLTAASRSRRGWLRALNRLWRKLGSGIPMLVWLMVLYYVVFAGVDISAMLVAIICFGLVGAGGIAGVYETGLAAVSPGEVEAAHALGFSRAQTFRRIVVPQAVQRVWGLYAGQFVGFVKQTSIVGYVAIQDLTKASDIIRSRTFDAFFPLIATALVYFVVIALAAWLMGRVARALDAKRRSPSRVLRGIKTEG